jgi:hypothetical protein
VPTPCKGCTATASTHSFTANLEVHVSNCICLHPQHHNSPAHTHRPWISRSSRKVRKPRETNRVSTRFLHPESNPSLIISTPVRTALTSSEAGTQNP